MLELILENKAPYAILLRDVDAILCAGAMIAEEFFASEIRRGTGGDDGRGSSGTGMAKVPIIAAIGVEDFARLEGRDALSISRRDHGDDIDDDDDEYGSVWITGGVDGELEIRARDLLRLGGSTPLHERATSTMSSSSSSMPSPSSSPAEAIALRTMMRIASLHGTTELIPITSAHIDAVTYIGNGGLRFANRLVELGGMVKVT